MINMIHRKIRINDDFSVSKVGISTQDKKEGKEQGKLPKISKMWNYKLRWFAKTKTFRRSIGRWSTSCFQSATTDGKYSEDRYDTHWTTDKCKSVKTRDILLAPYKRQSILHCIVHHGTGDKKWIYFENPKLAQAHHPPRPQARIAWIKGRCSIFGGTRGTRSIMSC